MPITIPQLDDLRYQVVFEQLRRQIPIYAPEWTDHNNSDPGITLLQLFAHLAEQVGYRLNQLPDKVYLELLKLVDIELRPAEAAATQLAFYLARPEIATAFTIPATSRVKGKVKTGTPPAFETTVAVDAVPAQAAVVATTQGGTLEEIQDGTPAPATGDTSATYLPSRYALAWDGRQPKLKDWPTQPVSILGDAHHRWVWVGLAFNPTPAAGFLGQRVTLTVAFDDDEQPDSLALGDAQVDLSLDAPATALRYVYYRPGAGGGWRDLRILSDTTEGWTRSGAVRFDVPTAMGPIPDGAWADLPLTPAAPHPLVGALKNPVQGAPTQVPVLGWIGVQVTAPGERALRAITFNAAPAINATTVTSELVGRGTGRSDQVFQLRNRNLMPGTLELSVEDAVTGVLTPWTEKTSFDTATADDTWFVVDREAGLVYFGDGVHGRAPALGMRIIALRYQWGGGHAGDLGPGLVTLPENLPSPVANVTNVNAARGGRDAETLADAKRRAPQVMRTRDRAVTAEDFDAIARRTPGAGIARTQVIPLRRPYQVEGVQRPGVDVDRVAPGAVTLVVVPQDGEPYKMPVETQLRTVCKYLDRFRLVTTELYVVPPMYVRLFDLQVTIVASPGYARAELRDRLAAAFVSYFDVLKGGPDRTGFPFGATITHAELVALAARTEGVDRVDDLVAQYDGNAPSEPGDPPPISWRLERATPRRLVACPASATEDERVTLFPDEVPFVDDPTLNVIVQ